MKIIFHNFKSQFTVSKACGGTTQYRNTYFYNPGYPSVFAGGSRCNYQVTRESTDICQLRIDFLEFSLAQPSGDGVCNTDYLAVTGGGSAVPRICGENAGSHVYVDFNGNAPITVTMASSGTTTFNRRWHMLMTQIECDSASRGWNNIYFLLSFYNFVFFSTIWMSSILFGTFWFC